MLPHHAPRSPAPFLACRGIRLRLHVRPNAFGNALGNSIAQGIAGGGSQQAGKAAQVQQISGVQPEDPFGDFMGPPAPVGGASSPGGQAWAADLAARRADSRARQIDEFLAPVGVGGKPAEVQPAADFSMADWKQKQVTALVNQGRYSEAAELQANELIMTDSGPRSLNGEPISAGAGQLAFKPPGLPDALKPLIPSTEVLPAATRTTALEMLQGLGRVAGVGFTLGLHMSDGPSTKWQAGGSSLSYTADDFTLRVATDGMDKSGSLAIPGIHNPSQYSDVQYLSYVSYRANGGQLGIHDYASLVTSLTPSASAGNPNPFAVTDAVTISGKRAIDLGQSYEAGVRGLYGNVGFQDRQYTAVVNGSRVNGVADTVTVVGGRDTAVEAKYVEDWNASLRNPNGSSGSYPWSVKAQQTMLNQALNYSIAFDGGVIYHTNSPELAAHYSATFKAQGITNFRFVITPATRR